MDSDNFELELESVDDEDISGDSMDEEKGDSVEENDDSDSNTISEERNEQRKDQSTIQEHIEGGQFQRPSGAAKKQFMAQQKNKRTQFKTSSDLRRFYKFLRSIGDVRKIEEINPPDLNELLEDFFMTVKKEDGSEYEPSSLRGMLASFNRYLEEKKYPEVLQTSTLFKGTREMMVSKFKRLRKEGKGNCPNASDALTDADIEIFYSQDLLGNSDPEALLRTLHRNNMIYFDIRTNQEHRSLYWGDIIMGQDPESGTDYLEVLMEHVEKRKAGYRKKPHVNHRANPRAYATPDQPERCPVAAYRLYSDLRPEEYSDAKDPFYVAVKSNPPISIHDWYKKQPVGIHKIASFVKVMVNAASIGDGRHLTNMSYRKHLAVKQNESCMPTDVFCHVITPTAPQEVPAAPLDAIEYEQDPIKRAQKLHNRKTEIVKKCHELATITGSEVFFRLVTKETTSYVYSNSEKRYQEFLKNECLNNGLNEKRYEIKMTKEGTKERVINHEMLSNPTLLDTGRRKVFYYDDIFPPAKPPTKKTKVTKKKSSTQRRVMNEEGTEADAAFNPVVHDPVTALNHPEFGINSSSWNTFKSEPSEDDTEALVKEASAKEEEAAGKEAAVTEAAIKEAAITEASVIEASVKEEPLDDDVHYAVQTWHVNTSVHKASNPDNKEGAPSATSSIPQIHNIQGATSATVQGKRKQHVGKRTKQDNAPHTIAGSKISMEKGVGDHCVDTIDAIRPESSINPPHPACNNKESKDQHSNITSLINEPLFKIEQVGYKKQVKQSASISVTKTGVRRSGMDTVELTRPYIDITPDHNDINMVSTEGT